MFLEFEEVSFSYGEVPALKSLSFSGDRGQIIGLIGENGAGKSTAIKTIVRYLKPSGGLIRLDGRDISTIKLEEYPISYIPDTPVFYEELSVLEHLQFVKALYPENPADIRDILGLFELEAYSRMIPAALSKGTRQKLMIAMAYLRRYEMLIADEPFTGLDPKQIAVLKNLLLQIKGENKLVLLSSHLLNLAQDLCDGYVIIKKGQLLAKGTKEQLLHLAGFGSGDSDISGSDLSMEEIYLKLEERHE